jgi:hypothetical protein
MHVDLLLLLPKHSIFFDQQRIHRLQHLVVFQLSTCQYGRSNIRRQVSTIHHRYNTTTPHLYMLCITDWLLT